jgi:hypothetical protein
LPHEQLTLYVGKKDTKPFDLIVEANETAVDNSEDGSGKFDEKAKNEIWLPGVDSNHEPPG